MAVDIEINHQSVTLQEKVRFLQQQEIYPEQTWRVETIETHMSWVFLIDSFVYKMKKPVRYDFLDYSTLAARKHFCEEEVRLNRRLAGPVYIGTVPLTADEAGKLHLAGPGAAVDWLVKMKRLPQELMLDCAIKNQTVTADDIRAVINRLARFYRESSPVKIEPDRYLARLRRRVEENRQELTLPKYGIPNGQVGRIHEAQATLLACAPELFKARAAADKIVEAHGDLRPEHICLTPEPVIIDCLEFEREFRILDPAEELAFLAMECELLGANEISGLIFETYGAASGDQPPVHVIHYYKSYRACVRAKIALWHIAEASAADAGHWRQRARDYLTLAEQYTQHFG